MYKNDIFIIKALGFSDTFIVQLASGPRHYATFLFITLLRRNFVKIVSFDLEIKEKQIDIIFYLIYAMVNAY